MAVDRPVTLAAITGAHGVRGEVRLKLFCEGPESLEALGTLDAGERRLTLKAIRPATGGAVARFAEITDRTAAEGLRGTPLTVGRDRLPPLGEGEYYHADLIGLTVTDAAGATYGEVIGIENYGAGDILDIRLTSGKAAMVPMRPEAVTGWDETRVIIDPAWLA